MVLHCVALGCSNRWDNNRPEIRFHRYPFSRPDVLENWIVATGRTNWKPTKYSVLCSEHFRKENYEVTLPLGRIYLKKDAVPEIFNYSARKVSRGKNSSKKTKTRNSKKKQPKLGSKNDVTNEAEEVTPAEIVSEQQNEHISIHDDIMMEEENETETPLCRLCASPSEDVISIFENKQSNCILEKIHTYLPIMMTAEDLLPTTVCGKCISRLEVCHSLVQDCLDADITLKTMFGIQNSNQVHNKHKNAAGKHSDSSCHIKDTFNNSLRKSKQCGDYTNLTDVKFEVETDDDMEAETLNQNVVESNGMVEVETSNQNAVESNGTAGAETSNQNAVGIMATETSNQIVVEKSNRPIQNNDAIQNSNEVTLATKMTEESNIQIVNMEPKPVNKSWKRKRKQKLKVIVVKKKAEKNVSEEAELQKMLEFALKKMNPKRYKTQMPKEKLKPREMPSVDNCSAVTRKEIPRLKDTNQNVGGQIHEKITRDHTYTRIEQEDAVDCEKT